MSDSSFQALLGSAFEALPVECPPAHATMTSALGRCAIEVEVGAELFAIVCDGVVATTAPARPGPDVRAATDRATILDLVRGRTDLTRAVLAGKVRIEGRRDRVLGFHDAWVAFVAGAVRAPSFPRLLARFEGQDAEPTLEERV